ncbi:hypothetical protein ACUH96_02425 [Dermabacteraceae bacterium P13077]
MENSSSSKTVSRRSVARGALWAAPAMVMASAAPALASSTCELRTAKTTRGGGASGTSATFLDPATGITIEARVVDYNANINKGEQVGLNMTKRSDGGLGLGQRASYEKYQKVVFTASAPLYGMKFTIEDIDSNKGEDQQYIDSVEIEGPVKATPVDPGYLKVESLSTGGVKLTAPGNVKNGDGVRPLKDGVEHNGDVVITAADPEEGITTFTIIYSNQRKVGLFGLAEGAQFIAVSAISFYDKASCV